MITLKFDFSKDCLDDVVLNISKTELNEYKDKSDAIYEKIVKELETILNTTKNTEFGKIKQESSEKYKKIFDDIDDNVLFFVMVKLLNGILQLHDEVGKLQAMLPVIKTLEFIETLCKDGIDLDEASTAEIAACIVNNKRDKIADIFAELMLLLLIAFRFKGEV